MVKNILFIGLGGAGQRHLRVFRELIPHGKFYAYRRIKKTPHLRKDFSVNSNQSLEEKFNIEMIDSISKIDSIDIDLAVISVPSSLHAETIIEIASKKINIFVEKPGSINYKQAISVVESINKHKVNLFVSYQRRFHPLVENLKNLLDSNVLGRIMNISVNVNSYFPSWHPYENYKDLYACNKSLGGGVVLTESHELDLICYLFGFPRQVFSSLSNTYKEKFDVEDTANLIFEYISFNAQVSLCFVQKKVERLIKIYTDIKFIELDLERQKLIIEDLDSKEVEVFEESISNEDLFLRQARFFVKNYSNISNEYCDSLVRNCKLFDLIL